jgi:hypothetical protein
MMPTQLPMNSKSIKVSIITMASRLPQLGP